MGHRETPLKDFENGATSYRERREAKRTHERIYESTAAPKSMIGARDPLGRIVPRQKPAETRDVFEERGGCARRGCAPDVDKKRPRSRRYTMIFVILHAKDAAVASRGDRRETRETRREHEIDQKSRKIEAEEGRRGEEAKGKRGRKSQMAEKSVTLAGIRVHQSRPRARTDEDREHVCTRTHARAPRVKNPRSYRVFVLLYHHPTSLSPRSVSPSVASCAFPTLEDVTSCNARSNGDGSARPPMQRLQQSVAASWIVTL